MNSQLKLSALIIQRLSRLQSWDIGFSDNTYLVLEDDMWLIALVGSDTGKRIFLMFDDTLEHISTRLDKLRNRRI